MFEEMQHSIVDQHMEELVNQAAEARLARAVSGGRGIGRSLRASLGNLLMGIGSAVAGRSTTPVEPSTGRSAIIREPCPEPARRDVARAA